MKIDPTTIRRAFQLHYAVYQGKTSWGIPYHLNCWMRGKVGFDNQSFADFVWLYWELRNRWQVFRPTAPGAWSAEQCFAVMHGLSPELREMSLHDFQDASVRDCWIALEAMSSIKPMKSGPSVVAISKFLHFWNPRLFLIVDDAVMWRWVFAHRWLREPVLVIRERLAHVLGIKIPIGAGCDLLTYVAILRWSADLLRANPETLRCFIEYIACHAEGGCPSWLRQHEAAAVEWLLLGLVEVPPEGVHLRQVEQGQFLSGPTPPFSP